MSFVKTGLMATIIATVFSANAIAQSSDDLLARGEYIARAADCAACHTNPQGGKPMAGGYSIFSPMGPIVATNITPSKEYGIGNWSEEDFDHAIRQGVTPDGTHLYPAMPYQSYAKMTDDDVKALYAYITQKVTPVDEAPKNKTNLKFPFNIRSSMIGFNMLFTPKPGWEKPAGLTDTQARGAYLVNALEHCGACHTPRGLFMNQDNSKFLGGGSLGSWRAPNITQDTATGIGNWSEDDIVSYLKNGFAKGKASAAGPMAEAIEHSLSHLHDEDLKAIAAYLKTVAAVSNPIDNRKAGNVQNVALTDYETTDWKGNPDNAAALAQHNTTNGAKLYNSACAACHGVDGQGAPDGHFPSLSKVSSVTSKDPSNLVMTIIDGISRHDARGYTVMPAFANDLNNSQIASLASYVSTNFGGTKTSLDAKDVAQIRAGGKAPWIAENAGWLTWVGVVIAIIVIAIIVAFLRRSKKSKRR